MDLNRLTIAVRPRRFWQTTDLGLKMARLWWWPMTRLWLVLTAPFMVLSGLTGDYHWVVLTAYWWTKPLWERPLLHFISMAVFDEPPTLRQSLRATPALLKPDLLASLLWRRLNPERSFVAPVLQLEGLRGAARQKRIGILSRNTSASAITLLFAHLEITLFLGVLLVMYTLIPTSVALELEDLINLLQSRGFNLLSILVYWLITAALAPFFVACGFALYLNRRVILEAWDIDIAFRRLMQRYASRLTSMILVLTISATLIISLPVAASEAEVPSSTATSTDNREDIHTQILAIKNDSPFHQRQQSMELKWRWSNKNREKRQLPDWLQTLLHDIAEIGEILLALIVALLILIVGLRYRLWQSQFAKPLSTLTSVSPADQLFGLDVRATTLPHNIPESAWTLIQNGQPRAGISLLYRGSLAQLVKRGLQVTEGLTEGDCLQQVLSPDNRLGLSQQSQDYLLTLTQAWTQLAYGHFTVASHQLEFLCQDWRKAWQHE